MDLKNRVKFNQLIKDKINERISKRKTLKQELLRLNSVRVDIECQINEQHQKLYLLGISLNDPEYDEKVDKLSQENKQLACSSQQQITDLRQRLDVVVEEIKTTFLEYNKML